MHVYDGKAAPDRLVRAGDHEKGRTCPMGRRHPTVTHAPRDHEKGRPCPMGRMHVSSGASADPPLGHWRHWCAETTFCGARARRARIKPWNEIGWPNSEQGGGAGNRPPVTERAQSSGGAKEQGYSPCSWVEAPGIEPGSENFLLAHLRT
jgi:hypothetical protein